MAYIDRQRYEKKDLEVLAGINHYTMNKLSREENVNIEVIDKICISLNCKFEDIIDFIHDKEG